MALYVSSATRLRRTLLAVAVAATVAFLLGWVFGRQQVPRIEDRVDQVRVDAANVATGLERLDIEYEQVLAGGDSVEAGVLAPLTALRGDLADALDDAPWITQSTRNELFDALSAIETAAVEQVPLDEFQVLVVDTGTAVRAAFGIT
jgi:hypothetical protein